MKDILVWAVPLAQLLLFVIVLPFLRSYLYLKWNHLRGIEERIGRIEEKIDRHLEWHATRGDGS